MCASGERVTGWKGGVASYGADVVASQAPTGAKQTAKVSRSHGGGAGSDSVGAHKQVGSQLHTKSSSTRSGRAEDPTPSRIAELLTDDEIEDDSGSELGKSMQQMGSLLNSLHSKEARLNWMLEAVRSSTESLIVEFPTDTCCCVIERLWWAAPCRRWKRKTRGKSQYRPQHWRHRRIKQT